MKIFDAALVKTFDTLLQVLYERVLSFYERPCGTRTYFLCHVNQIVEFAFRRLRRLSITFPPLFSFSFSFCDMVGRKFIHYQACFYSSPTAVQLLWCKLTRCGYRVSTASNNSVQNTKVKLLRTSLRHDLYIAFQAQTSAKFLLFYLHEQLDFPSHFMPSLFFLSVVYYFKLSTLS